MSIAISVQNVSKCYRLGAIGGATLKEDFARWWAKVRNKPDPFLPVGDDGHHQRRIGEQFWALNNVSFDVKAGEVLGIIGRNGAGKSTLLKILSQVTAPTSGEIKIRGRIASLLEVGTGFHPELTGRENVYLNGAILGMTKVEIRRKFDEIVAFSGIEQFIETPVKRYSSGMYVRLAFAVAAHLEPEILVVDEVLAVGDAEFQKKCLGKMENVARDGRTILFVSHNMAAMRSLCSTGVVLEAGRMKMAGPMDAAIDAHFTERLVDRGEVRWSVGNAPHNESVRFIRGSIEDENGNIRSSIDCSDCFFISLEYEILKPVRDLRIGMIVENNSGLHICGSNNENITHGTTITPGSYKTRCRFPAFVLNVGTYLIRLGADAPPSMLLLLTEEYLTLHVEDTVGHGPHHLPLPGIVRPNLDWSSTQSSDGETAEPLLQFAS